MGAHLEAQATKMRAIFVVIALSLIATMKKKGATEADCKDLAKTTCKEVLSEVKKAQKCKMMQCVLKGIKTSNKKCRATLPSLRNKVLSRNTEHAKRSGICKRHAKENHLKGERKSKSRARERKAKQIRKEKSAKEVRREKSAKAARRERAAKARAREQKAKHHEKRAKAAERSSKERSGKRERSHKARLRVERANKSKIRARRHWWHGNINGWDGHMNWSVGGTTYISGLQSWHNNGREDRIFRPLLTTIGAGQYGRQWSGWVNNMDAYFAYSCPNNKAMVGMLSYHHNGYEDRRWRFMCAGFHGVGFRKGAWPRNWQTNWDAHFALSCGHNPVVGFSSYHNNHKEDRRWRQQCGHRYVRM